MVVLMRLPNGDQAIVEIVKLQEYCLSPTHPRGRHKARVFAAVLGLTADNAELLRDALLRAALTEDAPPTESRRIWTALCHRLSDARSTGNHNRS